MKTIYDYINEASILGDIDDVLSDGDEYAQKKEIAEWLNDNFDFVRYNNSYNISELLNDPNKISVNNKGEIDLYSFKPYYNYAENPNKFLDLPIPEYIKLNNVSEFDIVGTRSNIEKIDMNKLPHINSCTNIFLRNWNTHDTIPADLSKLNNIDDIGCLIIDVEGIHPEKWPKSNISCVRFAGPTYVTNYEKDYLEDWSINYNISKLKGLKTKELVIPDFFITENRDLFWLRSTANTIITDTGNPDEWDELDLLFHTKSFDKLYIYKPTNPEKCFEVKKDGKWFVIKHRSTNILKKYLTY